MKRKRWMNWKRRFLSTKFYSRFRWSREVILLRIREELKFQEIADMQGCSLSTVKSRYRLGIERLRKEMADYEKRG